MIERNAALIRRFSQATGWPVYAALLLTGGLVALGQAPFDLAALAFAALAQAIFLGVATHTPRQAAGRGFVVGLGFSFVTFLWVVEPFLVDIKTHGWMAPFALLLMASGNGVFWALAYWAGHRLAANRMARGFALALMLAATELLRSYVFTGFPWALASYIWIDTPIYQFTSLTGPHGLTLATMILAATVVWAGSNRRIGGLAACAGLFASAWFGGAMIRDTAPEISDEQPVIRLIQPNAKQHEKWDPDLMPVFYDRQLALSAQPAAVTPDLVIWPEVAVPFLLNDPAAPFWEISDAARGVPVILGAQRLEGRRAYNSLGVVQPGGEITQQYDKHHLVPFGEYIPGEWLFSRIGLKAMTAQYGFGYSPGIGPKLIDLGELGQVLPLICYEGIFPHEMRRVETRPDWMLILTNDAWYGEIIGPFQHLAQARARAIEFSLPMVRVANTGVSAVFDARGHLIGSLPLGQAGLLDIALPPPLAPSTYWKTGDIPAVLVMIVLFGALYGAGRRKGLTQP